jgi:hypothetical protein
MKALSVWDALQPKLVQGSSIAQAFQFKRCGRVAVRWKHGLIPWEQKAERRIS